MGIGDRRHTRAICLVHSHVRGQSPGKVDVSEDLWEFRTSKQLKKEGGLSFTLVPNKNYLNVIFPNDTVDFYVDTGDGNGFIRLFMGFVDRIQRTSTTDERGGTKTVFNVTCTDFQKAFTRTEVYFNPHLQNRHDFLDPRFGANNIAGIALMTAGLKAHGTPADMIESMAGVLLGFGSQWVLPPSYPKSAAAKNREIRKYRARKRISKHVLERLSDVGTLMTGREFSEGQISQLLNDKTEFLRKLEEQINTAKEEGADLGATGEWPLESLFRAGKDAIDELFEGNNTLSSYAKVAVDTKASTSSITILDLINFGFIETMAVDGFIQSTGVWTQQGSLVNIMGGHSNEIVNELFWDLRPIASTNDGVFGTEYSREPDSLGINYKGTDALPSNDHAVRYEPALVFREYPWSTVEGLDLSNHMFGGDDTTKGRFLPFGPVFAVKPNQEKGHRVLYDYATAGYPDGISPASDDFEPISAPLKHLDVASIDDTDVINEQIGRSDNDVFNLFALYANGPGQLTTDYKFLLQDFMPIVTPVSIVRNGLRVREMNTRYVNYARGILQPELPPLGVDAISGGSTTPEPFKPINNVDHDQIRVNLTRWCLLTDHWAQHNAEYLSGEITLVPRPDIRVGYRLDWRNRCESYYVESVNHEWRYPGKMTTKITVSRGQRNDPFPAYIPPQMTKDSGVREVDAISGGYTELPQTLQLMTSNLQKIGGGNRTSDGRLGQYFPIKDTHATERALDFKNLRISATGENTLDISPNANFGGTAEYANIAASRDVPLTKGAVDSKSKAVELITRIHGKSSEAIIMLRELFGLSPAESQNLLNEYENRTGSVSVGGEKK